MRKSNSRALGIFVLLFALAGAAAWLGGCGDDSSSTQGGSVSTAIQPAGETPLPAPKPDPGQPAAVEQPSPYGAGSSNPQAVGLLIDGLKLLDVRSADHDTYYRFVFDFGTPEGEPVLQVPHAETTPTPDGRTIRLTISGVRSIGSAANANATEIPVNNSFITNITRAPSMDDQALIYEIHLKQATTYALAGLGSPGRIVIDVIKP